MSPRNGAEPGSDVHRRLAALEAEITRLRAALAAARLETRGAQAATAIALDATREARTDAAAAATRHARSMAEGRADLADAAALNARLRDLNAALRASEERLDAVVESATDNAIIQMDFDGRITGWSPGAERVLGWSAAEAIGQDGAIIWTPEDCAAALPERERRLADMAGSAAGDRWHVKRDGTRFWGSGHLTPLRNGRPRGYLKVLRDRTAEWRAEEVLRENAARGAFLLALSDALRSAAGPQAAMAAAAGLFARRLGLALAQYLVIHPDGDGFDVVASCGDGRLPAALARSGRISDHGPGWGEQFRRGEAVFCDDHEARPAADAVASRAFGVRAGSAVPLLRDGRLVAIFATAHPEPRRWTEAEKALQHEVAERTWAAVEQARAEAARREAEARFRAMADTAPVLIWESDETGVTFVNGHYLAFFGVAFDAVRGMGWTDFLHPDDAERYVAEYRDASSARRPCALEARFRRADGQYRWLRNTGGPVGEARFVGCSLDVTDLLDAQLALRASQARLAADLAAMEALQRISGELVGERDPASLYARIVEAAAALMRADAACMQALDTAAGRLKLVAWRGLDPAAAAHWDQVRADTGSVCGRALAGDARIVVPDLDATDRDAEDREAFRRSGILSFQSTPLRARSGRVVGMLSTHWRDRRTPCAAELRAFDVLARLAADLVERLQVDERLRESEGRFRDFAENSADVLWITDRAGKRLEYLSPAFERVFGEPRDRVMADLRRFHELVHPEDRAAVAGLLPRALAGEAVVAHYRVVRPCDGRITHLRDTGFPIRDASGGVARAAGIAQDVSDIARASAALAAEKERFRTLAEGIPQLVFRSGPAGDWSWASPQWTAFTGLSDAASRGRGWL